MNVRNLLARVGIIAVVLSARIPGAQADIFVVTNHRDGEFDSLRSAIIKANRKPDCDFIILPGSTYKLTLGGLDEESRSGDLDILPGKILIIGREAGTTIDATALGDRIFHLRRDAHLTLLNLTLKGGKAMNGKRWPYLKGDSGGAILNAGNLVLQCCRLVGNRSGDGGTPMGNGPGGSGGDGGAIYNVGTVVLHGCELAGNITGDGLRTGGGGFGGALYNGPTGLCIAKNCTFSSNATGTGTSLDGLGVPGAAGSGGAICNLGRMLIRCSTVAENRTSDGQMGGHWDGSLDAPAFNGSPGGSGGGIHNNGNLRVVLSTISGNECGSGGDGASGGRASDGGKGGDGGGLCNTGPTAKLSLVASTICLNRSGAGGEGGSGHVISLISGDLGQDVRGNSGAVGQGGGISNDGRLFEIGNSIVAWNTCTASSELEAQDSGPDMHGQCQSLGHNFVGMLDGSHGITDGFDGSLAGTFFHPLNPSLLPLAYYGGPTQTHALADGSPAIDAGRRLGLLTDQRGAKRPRNLTTVENKERSDGSDIGAFETQTSPK